MSPTMPSDARRGAAVPPPAWPAGRADRAALTDRVTRGVRGTWTAAPVDLLLADEPGPQRLDATGFADWCAAHPGARCRLWLHGALTLPMLVDASVVLPDEAALVAYVQRVVAHWGLDVDARMAVATWRQPAPLRGPAGAAEAAVERLGACLWPGAALDALRTVARRHGVRLIGVRPYWALAWQRARERQPALARADGTLLVLEDRVLTELQLRRGRVAGLRRRWLARADGAALAAACADTAGPCWRIGHGAALAGSGPGVLLGRGDEVGHADALLGGPVPAAPEFLPVAPAAPWLGWAFAASAVAVLALNLAERLPAPPPLAPRPAVAPAWLDELQARLGHPWHQVFAAADAASTGQTQWLALEHQAPRAELRLQGSVPDRAEALAAADAAARLPGVAQAVVSRTQTTRDGRITADWQITLATPATAEAAR